MQWLLADVHIHCFANQPVGIFTLLVIQLYPSFDRRHSHHSALKTYSIKFAAFGLHPILPLVHDIEMLCPRPRPYLFRYIPVGLLEVVPQRMHWRPPAFAGRSDLETLMASDNAADWVRISEMLLGPVPPGFTFQPKHKSNAYATEAG